METREKILDIVKKILMGPNPLPQFMQKNGEEILFCDSPLKTYVTGVLFPQTKTTEGIEETENDGTEFESAMEIPDATVGTDDRLIGEKNVAEPSLEAETSKINNFKQSAMGITFCLPEEANFLDVKVYVGAYEEKMAYVPMEKKEENGERKIVYSEKEKKCYYRKQINSLLRLESSQLPTKEKKHVPYKLLDTEGKLIDGLQLTITFRLKKENFNIYTITLVNTKLCADAKRVSQADCWFQCGFSIEADKKLLPLPANFCEGIKDEDYRLNSLLYRDVKTYAIGHGCAATWDDNDIPNTITASIMPEYEVKPIVPTTSRAQLSMKLYAQSKEETINDLQMLCDDYRDWISKEKSKFGNIKEEKYKDTALTQITLCNECLKRMLTGVDLLKTNSKVWQAFSLANRAMLMQQLHYKLPLTEYESYDSKTLSFKLKNEIIMPDIDNEETWYNREKNIYGRWRPFQIAFILLNLYSIYDTNSSERDIVDLIWFPTGGGKTEAYLGLTAFSIFMRRIKNPNDLGTTVIMRYTLRLLTAQQYERAASLICAIEKIRSENEELLGKERITIGLWVGDSLTKNRSTDVIKKIKDIRAGKVNENVSVILKCPWCGASMETLKTDKTAKTPGYEISVDKKHVIFRCGNENCDFGDEEFPLPLNLFDDEIYANPPTLLFGTVDKFAMLPYRLEAKGLFGGDNERTPPELIIQDELHLITGPLGSSVGLYETLIHELCIKNGSKPKIVASTATISHAKQQCNALYGCGEDKVFQFPVQGTTYKDCFFAEEKNDTGRKYVGLYGASTSSSATASIYTFAAFLYAAKAVEVDDESQRDAYWTNLAYFGSMRELGQAATWFIADIKEHLEVIYRNRLESSLDSTNRRYVYENGLAELTSRMSNEEIPKILKRLEIKYRKDEKRALDVCLATNMISVGVDISRLGLMTVTGQPKSMSEYIQATSRVGRDKNAPGLVFVIYNTSKSRDKSHYEKFQSQHSKLYFSVEPTSVTPFSRPLRERALPAIFVALHRFFVEKENSDNARRAPTQKEYENIVNIIVDRAEGIDSAEIDDIKRQLYEKWEEWKAWKPEKFHSFTISENAPLLCMAGTIKPSSWDDRGWESPTSMRSVDRECGLTCGKVLRLKMEDEDGE
ncbi:MAG: hypothetical protein LUF82_04115 [Clostridia bacterium]|nr:hypothetical protein [Clostridia bacterium]